MPWLRMRDFWTGKVSEVLEQEKCTDSQEHRSLLVKVAATHAGIVNGNMRFYRPDRMQDAVSSWVPKFGYRRPVLIGHNEDGEVLGRVMTARYVDESFRWTNDFPVIKDSLFYRTDAKKTGLHESVDWIVENLQGQDGYAGLGYIELGLNVTNPVAVDKVLRDEYLTVSVGFKTDSAICSVCHQDWAVDDKCDHKLGSKTEDGKRVFLITGNFDYEEVSFVNFPADPFAGTISKEKLADALSKKFFLGQDINNRSDSVAAMAMTDGLYEADIEHVEETMAKDFTQAEVQQTVLDQIKGDALTAEVALELKAELQAWQPETDELKTKKRSLVSTLNAQIKKRGFDKVVEEEDAEAKRIREEAELAAKQEDASCASCNQDGKDDQEEVWNLDELTAEEKTFFEDEEGLYTELTTEIDAAIAAGEISAEDAKDKKLSSEARKKLKGSTFCGPNRSFPVPDCAHVTAARRLIGRAKVGESTKSKILACVSRKASKLGCGGKKDAVTPQTPAAVIPPPNTDRVERVLTKLNLKDGYAATALKCINQLDEAYDAAEPATQGMMRSAVSALLSDWDSDSFLMWSKQQLEQERDMVVLPKGELADKEEALNKLSDEKTTLQAQLQTSKDTTGAMLGAYKKAMAHIIVFHRVIKGEDGYKDLNAEQITAKVEEISKRHVDSLKDMVADIMSGLKPVTPVPAARKEEVIEPGQPVADNVQIAEPAPAVSEKDEAEKAEAEKAARQQEIREQLRYMSDKERRMFLSSLGYEAVKTKK